MQKSTFLKQVLTIAIPISIQSIIHSSLSIIDQFMIGQLGKDAIAAVGIGSRVPFLLIISLAGITSSAAIFTSQFWGKKDRENIGQILGITLLVGLTPMFIFTLLSLIFPRQILTIFSSEPNIIDLSSSYLRIMAIGYIPMLLVSTYSTILRSTGHVRLPMFTGILSVILNTFLNYLLIFGNFGFPALGFTGAAYATTITRFVECILLIGIAYTGRYPGMVGFRRMFSITPALLKEFITVAAPLLLNEFLWATGETMYSIVFGQMGSTQIAAMTITYPVQGLTIGLFIGISTATGIMIGNKLGNNEEEDAFQYARKFIRMGLVGSSIVSLMIILLAPFYVKVYNIPAEVKNYAIYLLIVFGAYLPVKISNMIAAGGVLRSGGKTRIVFVIDMIGSWGFGVPVSFIAAFVFKLPIHGVYLVLSLEEVLRLILGLRLVYQRKWMKNLVESHVKEESAVCDS